MRRRPCLHGQEGMLVAAQSIAMVRSGTDSMATPTLVLVVDNRPPEQVTLARLVSEAKCNVLFADDIEQPAADLRSDVEIVVCRLQIGKTSSLDFMRRWHLHRRDTAFIILVGRNDASKVGEAVKSGATCCLLEPIDADEFRIWLQRCLAMASRRQQIHYLQSRLDERYGFENIIGQTDVMQRLVDQARAAADSSSDVVIIGEPGTGKSLFAKAIHHNSPRRAWPFVSFDVIGLSVWQTEQNLFGMPGGVGAAPTATHPGRLDSADGGTLFLDDVADLAAVTQARLLRALERRGSDYVGISPTTSLNVRIIAATVRKLDALAAEGRFSPALYRRLSGFQLRLPPLRERREDIPLLADYLLRQACQRYSRPIPTCEPELVRFLERLDWPENVRQLRNCLERMTTVSQEDVLTLDDLPADIDNPAPAPAGMYLPPGMTLAEIERTAIEQALTHCGGNRTRAAELLGISVRTLQRKLKCWSLEGLDVDGAAAMPTRGERSI
jgi:DNA-binding NtrC family response regulator